MGRGESASAGSTARDHPHLRTTASDRGAPPERRERASVCLLRSALQSDLDLRRHGLRVVASVNASPTRLRAGRPSLAACPRGTGPLTTLCARPVHAGTGSRGAALRATVTTGSPGDGKVRERDGQGIRWRHRLPHRQRDRGLGCLDGRASHLGLSSAPIRRPPGTQHLCSLSVQWQMPQKSGVLWHHRQ